MGKLVRDFIPKIIRANGEKPITRQLNDEEYLTELDKKLVEEAKEVGEAKAADEKLAELADLEEVKLAILNTINRTQEELKILRLKKAKDRGGFDKRIFWEGNE